jgi:hypothetical protein
MQECLKGLDPCLCFSSTIANNRLLVNNVAKIPLVLIAYKPRDLSGGESHPRHGTAMPTLASGISVIEH